MHTWDRRDVCDGGKSGGETVPLPFAYLLYLPTNLISARPRTVGMLLRRPMTSPHLLLGASSLDAPLLH